MQIDDDKFDPTQLDRGDTVEVVRDEKGRFASKDAAPEEEKKEDVTPEVDPGAGADADADADDDADADADEDDADEDEKKPQKDDKNYAIRLAKAKTQRDEARKQAEALAARLKAIEDKLAEKETPKQEPRVDPRVALEAQAEELYEKVEAARADGDTKQAAALQRELDKLNREISRYEAAAIAGRTTAKLTASQQYNAMLDVAEAVIDELNPDSDSFSREAVQQLTELVELYESQGLSAPAALSKATKAMYRIDLSKPPAPKAKTEETAKPAARKPNIAKAVDAANRQPPDTSGRGVSRDPGAIDVRSLSEEEFEKLPASKKAQLRGDNI